ncbi:MAG: hypothetical protein Q9162_006400 [Coniocarpon cinnabarinum]
MIPKPPQGFPEGVEFTCFLCWRKLRGTFKQSQWSGFASPIESDNEKNLDPNETNCGILLSPDQSGGTRAGTTEVEKEIMRLSEVDFEDRTSADASQKSTVPRQKYTILTQNEVRKGEADHSRENQGEMINISAVQQVLNDTSTTEPESNAVRADDTHPLPLDRLLRVRQQRTEKGYHCGYCGMSFNIRYARN